MQEPHATDIVRALPEPGMFVAAETAERMNGRPLVLRLGANESPFGPPPSAVEAMQHAAAECSLYGDPEVFELRKEISRRLAVGLENILVTAGIDEALSMTVRCFMSPGDIGVSSDGCYPMFPYLVRGYGGVLETVAYRDDRNDVEALAKKAREHSARVVYLPNPDNPSGSLVSRDELDSLVNSLPDACLLILDEAYHEFSDPHEALPVNTEQTHVLRLRTFSKIHGMAGARVGYAIGSTHILESLDRVRLHFGVNRVGQAGALAALKDEGRAREVLELNETGRLHYAEIGAELGLPTLPSATNFVAFDCGSPGRAIAIKDSLLDRDVHVRIPWAPPLDRCIRITIAPREQREELARRLADAIIAIGG